MILCSDVSPSPSSSSVVNCSSCFSGLTDLYQDRKRLKDVGRRDLRPQLIFLLLRVAGRRTTAASKGRLEDRLGLSRTLAQQRVAFQVVLFCRGCSAELYQVVLEVAEVSHDLRNTHSAGIVHCGAVSAIRFHCDVDTATQGGCDEESLIKEGVVLQPSDMAADGEKGAVKSLATIKWGG